MVGIERDGQLGSVRTMFDLHFCAVLNFGGIYFETTEAIQSLFELPASVSDLETLISGVAGKPASTHKVVV